MVSSPDGSGLLAIDCSDTARATYYPMPPVPRALPQLRDLVAKHGATKFPNDFNWRDHGDVGLLKNLAGFHDMDVLAHR